MEIILVIVKYWREISIAAIVAAIVAVCINIKETYNKVDEQQRKIEMLDQQVKDAKQAVQLQIDLSKALGRIDAQTYRNISTILHRPVGRVLIHGGM